MFGSESATTTNTWQVCDYIALRVYIVVSFKHGPNQEFVQVGGMKREGKRRGGGTQKFYLQPFNNNGFKYRTRV
jgi:hypothetical protein